MGRSEYVFADRPEEQRRLERQAEFFDPLTERVFRAASLGPGMRVLDLGSGAGDVAMLAARFVGSDGEVVGVERDAAAVASATARIEQAGISNVRFVEGDVQTLAGVEGEFDAVVGRLVLMYVPDHVAVLTHAIELVRPGGSVCVQEGEMTYDWAQPMTPLWTQVRARPFGDPGAGRRCAADGAVVVLEFCRRRPARTRAAPGVRGSGRPRGLGLGVGQRSTRSTASHGATRDRNRRGHPARHARPAPAR